MTLVTLLLDSAAQATAWRRGLGDLSPAAQSQRVAEPMEAGDFGKALFLSTEGTPRSATAQAQLQFGQRSAYTCEGILSPLQGDLQGDPP